MKKIFIITDVHSFYDEMIEALDELGFDRNNEDHILISLGDLLDRGPKPLECLNYINSLPKNRKILIRGNHEDLLEEALARGFFLSHDYHNCTIDTCAKLAEMDMQDILDHELTLFAAIDKIKNRPELNEYLNSLVDYFEMGEYVFVHGWVPTQYKNGMPIYNIDMGLWKDGDWEDARWTNGMRQWSGAPLKNKTVVCGHYHTSWGHAVLHSYGVEFDDEYYEDSGEEYKAHFEPFVDEGIIALDSCCAYSGFLNCVATEVEDKVWQSSM